MACSHFMVAALLVVVRGNRHNNQRHSIMPRGEIFIKNQRGNRSEKNVSTVEGSYRHHQSMGLSRTQPISAHLPMLAPPQSDIMQQCAGFIYAILRWSLASLSLPTPQRQKDLLADRCSAKCNCFAITSTVPCLMCKGGKAGVGIAASLLNFSQELRSQPKSEFWKRFFQTKTMQGMTMQDMYRFILGRAGVTVHDQADPWTGNFYVINPLNGSWLVPGNGVVSDTLPLSFGKMEILVSDILPPPKEKKEATPKSKIIVQVGRQKIDNNEFESEVAQGVYKCGRLAILMCGEYELVTQKDMYDELLEYDIDEHCIVVFTYTTQDLIKFQKSWEPHWQLAGDQFDTFMKKLEALSPHFKGVLLMYVGHGLRGSLCTSENRLMKRDEFLGYMTKLSELAENLFVFLEACHSASMLVEDDAQLLPNAQYLYASRILMEYRKWRTTNVINELEHLFGHFPGLARTFMDNVLFFQVAYWLEHEHGIDGCPCLNFDFKGFTHDIDIDMEAYNCNYEDRFNLTELENSVREYMGVVGVKDPGDTPLTSRFRRQYGFFFDKPDFKKWLVEMQKFQDYFLEREKATQNKKVNGEATEEKKAEDCCIIS